MHSIVNLPSNTLQQKAQDNNNDSMSKDKVKHSEPKITKLECMIISNHWPSSFNKDLNKNELSSNKSFEIGKFIVVVIRRLIVIDDTTFSENDHSKDSKDIVSDHEEGEKF